jgi:hypothetical protein
MAGTMRDASFGAGFPYMSSPQICRALAGAQRHDFREAHALPPRHSQRPCVDGVYVFGKGDRPNKDNLLILRRVLFRHG